MTLKTKLIAFLILLLPNLVFGNSDGNKTKRLGTIFTFDEEFNAADKVLNAYLGRKLSVGLSFTNKNRAFVAFAGIGIKGFKFNLYPTTFQDGFINDIKQNYVPVNASGEDSIVGAAMANLSGTGLWGTYSQYLHAGFIWNMKFKPTFNFYYGAEEFLLHDGGFRQYEDPKYGDINYVEMQSNFYEFKLGCTLPIASCDEHFSLNLNVGYKLVNYGDMSFGKTPLSAYTNGNLADKYNRAGKFTFSISFLIWSNWD